MPAAPTPDAPLAPRETVLFPSGADHCEAWLYRPDGLKTGQRRPIVVMAHGLGAVKALRLAAFAERFCAAGYLCLVFDYRYFGGSTGSPRELLDIPSQLADWRAAVNYARAAGSRPGAGDRLGNFVRRRPFANHGRRGFPDCRGHLAVPVH